jgi:hypothetical protein
MDGATADRRSRVREMIERDRAELQEAVDEIRTAAREALLVRPSERPYAWLATCMAIGMWLGFRSSRPPEA